MNVLDLFSGIGGFSLGLERAGMRTVAFCEIDPYCQRVLRKHWPDVPIHGDIRSLTGHLLAANTMRVGCEPRSCGHVEHEPVQPTQHSTRQRQDARRLEGKGGECETLGIDLICGGFPCQDISVAGKGAGIEGERSGLWSEYRRLIGELRPRYVIVENVAALLGRGIDRVLGDLAALGYDAEWHCIPASAVGAPHRRDRVWIVAHSAWDVRREQEASRPQRERVWQCGEPCDVADPDQQGPQGWIGTRLSKCLGEWIAGAGSPLEDTASAGWNGAWAERSQAANGAGSLREPSRPDWWFTEPDVGRVAHGVPSRVDRLRSLGNAIVPQIAEIIGRAIMELES